MRFLSAGLALFLAFASAPVEAQTADPPWRHGISLVGELRYPADFRHFAYVNTQAPKGGSLRLATPSPFDSFNFFIPRGVAPAGIQTIYQTLLDSALDEISSSYGELAEALRYPDDFSWVAFRLREGARWHDGRPVTPEDVIWSFNALVQNHPSYRFYYRNVTRVEKTGEREVTFHIDEPGNREIPSILGQIYVLPQHWWTGTDANGRQRDITQPTLEAPLGSGPYRIESFEPNRSITYRRVADWWAVQLPVNVGRYNFDTIRYDVYRDEIVAFEAFKADQVDFRRENSARQWATQYDFPALRERRVVRETFPQRASGRMQGFVFNLRRERFQDARVRLAFNHAFDFETLNRDVMFGQYQRINSYFQGTDLASTGLPQGLELEILNTVRDQVPPEVFTREFRNPTGGSPAAQRDNLREALRLFRAAGWVTRDSALVNAQSGERMRVEFLINSPGMDRIVLPYRQQLERLGVESTIRVVDASQYVNRLRSRDFDVVVNVWPQSLSPGNEQRDFFGSAAAEREGSRNVGGIRNPAIDTLIDRLIRAPNRAELEAATRALDRVLLWNHYVVPQFTASESWTARWDRFGHPPEVPRYSTDGGFPDIWWFDAERAARVGGRS
jgi:microcin C transport system substrate-binding protein